MGIVETILTFLSQATAIFQIFTVLLDLLASIGIGL